MFGVTVKFSFQAITSSKILIWNNATDKVQQQPNLSRVAKKLRRILLKSGYEFWYCWIVQNVHTKLPQPQLFRCYITHTTFHRLFEYSFCSPYHAPVVENISFGLLFRKLIKNIETWGKKLFHHDSIKLSSINIQDCWKISPIHPKLLTISDCVLEGIGSKQNNQNLARIFGLIVCKNKKCKYR